jgi:L-fuconolactonase
MAPTPNFHVIDTHSHVISADLVRFPTDPMGGKQSEWSRERPVDATGMLKAMQAAGVHQSVLVQASTCYGHDNSYVAAAVREHPAEFAGVYSVDFSAPDAVERIEHWRAQGLAGVRVFVAGHTAAAENVRVDDPRSAAAWEHLAREGIPVSVQLRADKLDQLRAVLTRWPTAVVLLDHCARPELEDGPPYASARSLFELAAFPQLHLKYTTHNVRESAQGRSTPAAFCEALVDAYGAHRIAWGSNFPASPGGLTAQLQQALAATAGLGAERQAWIFSGTARALYPSLAR